MINLYQRPGSPFWWYSIAAGGQRARGSTKTTNRDEAELIAAAAAAKFRPASDTVGALLDGMIGDLETKRRRSLRVVTSQVNHLRDAFGSVRRSEVDREALKAYQRTRVKTAKPRTVDIELSLLSRAFRLGGFTPPPFERMIRGAANARQGFLEPKDVEKLIGEVQDKDLADFVEFIFLTGRRVGEVAAYEWRDVQSNVLLVRPEINKTEHPETIPLEGRVADIIERRRAAKSSSQFVFHGRGTRLSKRVGGLVGWAQAAFKAAAAKIGQPNLNPHDARRSATRNMIRAGAAQTVVMKITGHRSDAMFRRYNITSEEDQRKVLARM